MLQRILLLRHNGLVIGEAADRSHPGVLNYDLLSRNSCAKPLDCWPVSVLLILKLQILRVANHSPCIRAFEFTSVESVMLMLLALLLLGGFVVKSMY